MAGYYTESNYENAVLQLLNEGLGYTYVYGPDVERDYHSPLYEDALLPALQRINKGLPLDAINEAIYKLKNFASGSLLQKNMTFTDYLQNGISVKYFVNGEERSTLVYLVDFKNPANNDFTVANQWTFIENSEKRPDVILLNFRDDMLKHELQREFPQSPPFLYRDEVLLLLEEPEILEPLEALARQNRLRVVVTDPFEDLYLLPQVYQAAQEVMQYLFTHREGAFVVQTGQCRNLMRLRQLAQRPDFIDPQIKEVAAYDERHGTQFCLTLYTYCICHHSIQQTCERLFTHRNTVLYRLRKLKEDFGLRLDDPEETMPLLVSSALALLQSHQDQLFVRDFSLGPRGMGGEFQEECEENGQK